MGCLRFRGLGLGFRSLGVRIGQSIISIKATLSSSVPVSFCAAVTTKDGEGTLDILQAYRRYLKVVHARFSCLGFPRVVGSL